MHRMTMKRVALEARKLALQKEYEELQRRSAAEHGVVAAAGKQLNPVPRAEQMPSRAHDGVDSDNLRSDKQFFLNERVRDPMHISASRACAPPSCIFRADTPHLTRTAPNRPSRALRFPYE